ncbi:pepsin/retropepsin-like aspartic protease family protein [Massilia sp. TS11]|uniref:pepsin/retropepsin-like aspartic protease family protein n=1 Tax=Massilia sp. TS11 TaxID=2908003 RepID=UPI001EDAA873|nr:pepsin/retropepsin-like aspartic protease family protein [Massilia sp. TS11]MCG2583403.1 hypothetical protein [Massilia sp. TS11]
MLLRPVIVLAALLLASASQAEPAPRCELQALGSLPVRLAGPALLPVVDGRLNGRSAPMLLSTGTSDTGLLRAPLEKSGLAMRASFVKALSGDEQRPVYMASVDEFAVGPARAIKGKLLVYDEGDAQLPFVAVVGRDFLYQNNVEFHLAAHQLNFFAAQHCEQAFMGYWDDKASVLSMADETGGPRHAQIEVQLNGETLRAVVMSSEPYSMLSERAAARLGLADSASDGPRKTKPINQLRIGDELIAGVRLRVGPLVYYGKPEEAPELWLGLDFLRQHRVLMAVSQRAVYISHLGGPAFANSEDDWRELVRREARAGNPDAQALLR